MDEFYTEQMWTSNTSFGDVPHQWRAYSAGGEEVARVLLSLRYDSHLRGALPAVMIWNFEVREDLRRRGLYLGSMIVSDLLSDHADREVYAGPASGSEGFWKRTRLQRCECARCAGTDHFVYRP
ncbi:hypothetical protein BMW26_11235 [Microbacterium sp. 1.5R]|nr:hypothetical protein BMW26_11235 [Microbacterium sp. 1.5R]